jgi:glycosyltransferase involved in cell wall biosynthesis
MAEKTGVSVIATILNEAHSIAETIANLVAQTRSPDEIIVVDGGSTDGTIRQLEEFACRDPRIRVLVEPGSNISRGRNVGIAAATNDIIAITDAGCRPEPTWLAELVQPLLHEEGFDAVSGERRIEARTAFERYAGLLSTSRDQGKEEGRLFFGRSSAFRKRVWEAVGGYPEWLYTGEDTLFALRARELGFRVAYAAGSIVNWRPRRTWRKLAKQYFLYGRGNGRITLGTFGASLYHLRNHCCWMFCLAAGFLFPPLWIPALLCLGYLYAILVLPVLREVRREHADVARELYVPLIVMTRSFFHNLGFVVGSLEFRYRPPFRENLEAFRAGRLKCAGAGGGGR